MQNPFEIYHFYIFLFEDSKLEENHFDLFHYEMNKLEENVDDFLICIYERKCNKITTLLHIYI